VPNRSDPHPEPPGVRREGPTDDGELARRIASRPAGEARDEEAELLSRLARRVRLYGRRHLRDEDEAWELSQRVVLAVLGKLRAGEVREPDRIGSFALGTARRMALEMRRGQARLSELEEAPADLAAPPVEAPDPLDLDRLARCMESLTERERTVATLSFYAEQDSAAIANALKTSSGNVRVLRHRAVSRLRACMDPEEVRG